MPGSDSAPLRRHTAAQRRERIPAPGAYPVSSFAPPRASSSALAASYDLLGRLQHEDVRERSISALMRRYRVEQDTAAVVARRARTLFAATREPWRLPAADGELLGRAALAHEMRLRAT